MADRPQLVRTYSRDQRVAMAECARVIAMLVDATGPHSKQLAIIVASRLKALLEGDAEPVEPMPADEVAHWHELVRGLVD